MSIRLSGGSRAGVGGGESDGARQGVAQPLIGMSFLKRLSGYRAENDELKLIN